MCSRRRQILDYDDDVLIEIISRLNMKDCLSLGNSCTRFKSIVFGCGRVLRDLDFSQSEEEQHWSVTDIQEYFPNEIARQRLVRVNFQNVACLKSVEMLKNLIGESINLVDVNIHGIEFQDIEQLGNFLEPLVNVERLSLDWPRSAKDSVSICRACIAKPFSKLRYLSANKFHACTENFLAVIQFCHELEELYIDLSCRTTCSKFSDLSWTPTFETLKNLKVVQVHACGIIADIMKRFVISMLPDAQEWTEFGVKDVSHYRSGFYLEKNVIVCEELWGSNLSRCDESVLHCYKHDKRVGWLLVPEYLLKEAIAITHENVPENFCSLVPALHLTEQACLLRVDDAKRLLKDPAHPISYLHFKHSIDSHCDAHLVASAFPHLTEIVFKNILTDFHVDGPFYLPVLTPWYSYFNRKKNFRRRLRRKGDSAPEEYDNPRNRDSSFKMLVENTPHVKYLTIDADIIFGHGERLWDTRAMSLISLWKNLTVIRLVNLPVENGKFLIEIGKKCLKLEEFQFRPLSSDSVCYANQLFKMLRHCRNLQKFTFNTHTFDQLPELLTTLSNNPNLRAVGVNVGIEWYDFFKLKSSIEELFHHCTELTTFTYSVKLEEISDMLVLCNAIKRIVSALNRRGFLLRESEPYE